eukprot:scaffold912_cov187-Ochromonas_danica.AAC.49
MQQRYGQDELQQALFRIHQLDEENVQLRHKLFATNEENFNLQASMIAIETEARYAAEQEIQQLKSQIGFKDKELVDINNEYRKLLKEVGQWRQQQQQSLPEPSNVKSDNNMDVVNDLGRADLPRKPSKTPPSSSSSSSMIQKESMQSDDLSKRLPTLQLLQDHLCHQRSVQLSLSLREITVVFHELLFQHHTIQTIVTVDGKGQLVDGVSLPPTTPTTLSKMNKVRLGSLSRISTTPSRRVNNNTGTFVEGLQSASERLKVLPNDAISTLLSDIASHLSSTTLASSTGGIWNTQDLLSASIQLCNSLFSGSRLFEAQQFRWEDAAFGRFSLLTLRLLRLVISRLWLRELELRDDLCYSLDNVSAVDINLTEKFDAIHGQEEVKAVPSSGHDKSMTYEEKRQLIRKALKIPVSSPASSTLPSFVLSSLKKTTALDKSEFTRLVRELMESLFSISIEESKRKVDELFTELGEVLFTLLYSIRPVGYRSIILQAAVLLLGGSNESVNDDYGLLFEALMHPCLSPQVKSRLVSFVGVIVTQTDNGFRCFQKYRLHHRSSLLEKERPNLLSSDMDRPSSNVLCFLVSECTLSTELRYTGGMHAIMYRLEIVQLLLDLLHVGQEQFLTALLGINLDLAQAKLNEERDSLGVNNGVATSTSDIDSLADERPQRSGKKRKLNRMETLDSDEDDASLKTEFSDVNHHIGNGKSAIQSFQLHHVISKPGLMAIIDNRLLQILYTTWMHSWRQLDVIPVLREEQTCDQVAQIDLSRKLTILCNNLVSALNQASPDIVRRVFTRPYTSVMLMFAILNPLLNRATSSRGGLCVGELSSAQLRSAQLKYGSVSPKQQPTKPENNAVV